MYREPAPPCRAELLCTLPRRALRAPTGGSIRIGLPDDAAFEVDARTGLGPFRIDHPVTMDSEFRGGRLRGTVRGGGPRLILRTGLGGITID